jgi:hypothetical protein
MKIGNDALRAKLAKSVAVTPRKIRIANKPTAAPIATGAKPGRLAHPTTFTLCADDLGRIDTIRDYMRTQGARISASEAVKLALRAVKPGNDLAKLYDLVKADDGRRKR